MFKRYLGEIMRLVVCAAVMGAAIGTAQVWKWSQTAGSNATADPSINWAEGMAPSGVNDSARQMMAALAKYRDDISGSLTTGGTSTAYTLATNQPIGSGTPADGQQIAFTPNATNGSGVTLAVDGGTAFPIQSPAGTAIGAATLVQGTPYVAVFKVAQNAWVMRDVYGNPFITPIGGIISYVGSTAPNSNFALPFGQCISRTTFATLFALVGTTYSACDGSTTFGLPDLRGRAVFGWDAMGGVSASRITPAGSGINGGVVGTGGGAENETLTQAQLPSVSPSLTLPTATLTNPTATLTAVNGNVAGQYSKTNLGANFNAQAGGSTVVASLSQVTDNLFGMGFSFTSGSISLSGGSVVLSGGSVGSFGGGQSHPIMPPTLILPYIMRIQ